jgi:hypothetical protein
METQYPIVILGKGEPVLVGFADAGRDQAAHGDTADSFNITQVGDVDRAVRPLPRYTPCYSARSA